MRHTCNWQHYIRSNKYDQQFPCHIANGIPYKTLTMASGNDEHGAVSL